MRQTSPDRTFHIVPATTHADVLAPALVELGDRVLAQEAKTPPPSGLDLKAVAGMASRIEHIRSTGGAVLLATFEPAQGGFGAFASALVYRASNVCTIEALRVAQAEPNDFADRDPSDAHVIANAFNDYTRLEAAVTLAGVAHEVLGGKTLQIEATPTLARTFRSIGLETEINPQDLVIGDAFVPIVSLNGKAREVIAAAKTGKLFAPEVAYDDIFRM